MNVGIITYHSAYNFGSVLQALATQLSVQELGHQAQIINYRMRSQQEFYSFYRKNYGVKTLVKDVLLTPRNGERRIRNERFEKVINMMDLTEKYVEPDEVSKCESLFDCFVSGSDQIWNKRSCELTPVGWEYMNPYLLEFTDKKKVSYASSIASMTDEEIERILPFIKKFDHLSFRENISALKIQKKLDREVATVLDPTLLIDGDRWRSIFDIHNLVEERFIFYYSLAGYKDVKPILSKLNALAEENNCVVYAITPFISFKDTKRVKHIYNAGPVEFLNYIFNAALVVTDSYHGTLFSINLKRPFYSLTDGSDSHMRKNQILEALGLTDRICVNPENIAFEDFELNAEHLERIKTLKENSLNYLRESIIN